MELVRRLSLVGAWLLVVAIATVLTWQIVSAADDQVSDRAAPLNVAAPVLSSLTSTTTVTSTVPSTVTSTTVGSETSTTVSADSTGSTGQTTSTSTSTTAPDAVWQTKTVETAGGTVVLRYRQNEVAYQAASPKKGFKVEIDSKGPPEVELKFDSESMEIEVHAAWRDNQLDVKVSESGED
jgi:cytoskeletal protein RodZ